MIILTGSCAIKDIIERTPQDYDLYMRKKDFIPLYNKVSKIKEVEIEKKGGKVFIKKYLSKPIEITFIDNSPYAKELENQVRKLNKKIWVNLENKLKCVKLSYWFSFIELATHYNLNSKEKWKWDMKALLKKVDYEGVMKRYKPLIIKGRLEARERVKKRVLDPSYIEGYSHILELKEGEEITHYILRKRESVLDGYKILSYIYNRFYHFRKDIESKWVDIVRELKENKKEIK